MRRLYLPLACVAALLAALLVAPTFPSQGVAADEQAQPKEKPRPPVVSDEEAKEVLAAFKVAFKARGLKGDEKIAEQAHHIRQLADVQHPKVVDALAKIMKHRVPEVRTSAVLQLGKQRAIPAYAGKAVVKAMKKHEKDHTFTMAGLESIGALGYLGAGDLLRSLLNHKEYAVVKNALVTMGELRDTRFIEDIIKMMKKLKLEKGAKWDGVSVSYDTGTAGSHDQEMAEKIGKEAEAKNKRKGKRAARSQRDLGPIVLEVAKELTDQEFTGSIAARKWVNENKAHVAKLHAADEARQKAQAKAP